MIWITHDEWHFNYLQHIDVGPTLTGVVVSISPLFLLLLNDFCSLLLYSEIMIINVEIGNWISVDVGTGSAILKFLRTLLDEIGVFGDGHTLMELWYFINKTMTTIWLQTVSRAINRIIFIAIQMTMNNLSYKLVIEWAGISVHCCSICGGNIET